MSDDEPEDAPDDHVGVWKILLALWVILATVWTVDLVRNGLHRSAVSGLGLAAGSACLAIAQMQKRKSRQYALLVVCVIIFIVSFIASHGMPRRYP